MKKDASGTGMGVLLLQEGQPTSCPKLQNLSTYVHDYMPLLLLLKDGDIICLGENLSYKLIE